VIKNLGLENVNITGAGYTGAIVGGWNSGLIQNCYVTGTITANYQQVGGIAGSNIYIFQTEIFNHCGCARVREKSPIAILCRNIEINNFMARTI
jgi:hypothetical protein